MRARSAHAFEEFPGGDAAGPHLTAMSGEARRFQALWKRRVESPPSPDGLAVYAELCGRYAEPYRRFHNLDHIRDCLQRFDEVAELLDDPDAVELALWFHDAVYEVGATTNERRSAERFIDLSAGASFGFRHHVCGLIMATRHTRLIHGNDRRFMVDIDLSGFGVPWDDFIRNGARLREECAHQTDAQYLAGQVVFLSRLQRRPRFFFSDHFHDLYEAQARDNLTRLLAEIAQSENQPPTL
jgi:predicted metal-dependent HD superfamily phosphohydrolase